MGIDFRERKITWRGVLKLLQEDDFIVFKSFVNENLSEGVDLKVVINDCVTLSRGSRRRWRGEGRRSKSEDPGAEFTIQA